VPDLDATVGGATANSFVSLDDADEYLSTRTDWVDGDEDDKNDALIESARELSLLEPVLQGYRTDAVQALCFPRILVINTKAPWNSTIGLTGFPEYADDIIPGDWAKANIELGYEFFRQGTTAIISSDDSSTVIEKTVGPLTTRWASPVEEAVAPLIGLARFPRVLALVQQFFAADKSGNTVVRS
jgi:hypothetical protein